VVRRGINEKISILCVKIGKQRSRYTISENSVIDHFQTVRLSFINKVIGIPIGLTIILIIDQCPPIGTFLLL